MRIEEWMTPENSSQFFDPASISEKSNRRDDNRIEIYSNGIGYDDDNGKTARGFDRRRLSSQVRSKESFLALNWKERIEFTHGYIRPELVIKENFAMNFGGRNLHHNESFKDNIWLG